MQSSFSDKLLRKLRSNAYGALTSQAGNRLLPVRLAKSALLYANDVVGRPLATDEELVERAELEARMAARRQGGREGVDTGQAHAGEREAAPVVVFHLDKHRSEIEKITQILEDQKIPFTVRNIDGDDAARAAVKRDGKGFGLPVVFIAGTPVGRAEHLINLGKSGELRKLVFGA